jgi:hypothetical protein
VYDRLPEIKLTSSPITTVIRIPVAVYHRYDNVYRLVIPDLQRKSTNAAFYSSNQLEYPAISANSDQSYYTSTGA